MQPRRLIDHYRRRWGVYLALYILGVMFSIVVVAVWGSVGRQTEDIETWTQTATYKLIAGDIDNAVHFTPGSRKVSANLLSITVQSNDIPEPPAQFFDYPSGDQVELVGQAMVTYLLDEADTPQYKVVFWLIAIGSIALLVVIPLFVVYVDELDPNERKVRLATVKEVLHTALPHKIANRTFETISQRQRTEGF